MCWRHNRAPRREARQHSLGQATRPAATGALSCAPNVPLQRGFRGYQGGQGGMRRDDEPEENQGDSG
jgi:hypothetical protein